MASLYEALPDVGFSGFDIAPDASKFWDKHASKSIKFSVGDFLQEETAHFELLMLLDVIEHVANPFEFLSGLRGRADYFVFHIPLDLSALSVARESPLLHWRRQVGHIHSFTKGLALELLKECDFEVMDCAYTGSSFTVPPTTLMNRLAILPRFLVFGINRDIGVRLLGGDTLIVLAKAKGI